MAGVKNSYKSLVTFAASLTKNEYLTLSTNPIVRRYVKGILNEVDRVPQQFEHDVDKLTNKKYDAFDRLAKEFFDTYGSGEEKHNNATPEESDKDAMQYVTSLKDYCLMFYRRTKVYVKFAEAKKLMKEGCTYADSNSDSIVFPDGTTRKLDDIVNETMNNAEVPDIIAGMYIDLFGDNARKVWEVQKSVLNYSAACIANVTNILNRI